MTMNDVTVVFDLDGTLVETAPDLTRALNHVLAGIGLAPVDGDIVRPFIAFGARRMLEVGLDHHGWQTGEAEVDELFAGFIAYYGENVAVESRPYPGVTAALDGLKARGAKLGVCTNKREDMTLKLFAALGLTPYFDAILGRDTLDVCKPDPRHLTTTIARAGGSPERAIMIGDAETDIKTARAAGIPVVGTTFGYTDIPIEELAPDALLDDYADLAGILDRLLEVSS